MAEIEKEKLQKYQDKVEQLKQRCQAAAYTGQWSKICGPITTATCSALGKVSKQIFPVVAVTRKALNYCRRGGWGVRG